jgi:hypothetical protein
MWSYLGRYPGFAGDQGRLAAELPGYPAHEIAAETVACRPAGIRPGQMVVGWAANAGALSEFVLNDDADVVPYQDMDPELEWRRRDGNRIEESTMQGKITAFGFDVNDMIASFPPPPAFFETTWLAEPEQLAELQLSRLKEELRRTAANPFYARRWAEAFLRP